MAEIDSRTAEAKTSPVDVERLAILFQRRYNILRELKGATDDISEALSRSDAVSLDLAVKLRGDFLIRCDENWESILLMAEESEAAAQEMQRYAFGDPSEASPRDSMEERILEIRRKNRRLIQEIQELDQRLLEKAERTRKYYRSL